VCPRCGTAYDSFYATCANDGEVLKVIPPTISESMLWSIVFTVWCAFFVFLVMWGAHQF